MGHGHGRLAELIHNNRPLQTLLWFKSLLAVGLLYCHANTFCCQQFGIVTVLTVTLTSLLLPQDFGYGSLFSGNNTSN